MRQWRRVRAAADQHWGKQQVIGAGKSPTPMGGFLPRYVRSLPQCRNQSRNGATAAASNGGSHPGARPGRFRRLAYERVARPWRSGQRRCGGEGFGCRDEFDDAVGVVGVHGLPSRCGCATPIDLPYNPQSDLRNVFASVGIDFSLESGWKAADREPIRASVATLVLPTKSPLNWARARWPEGPLFGHWRSGVAFAQVGCRSTRRGVREHPAPSGALRCRRIHLADLLGDSRQGAPSTIRCIKTPVSEDERFVVTHGQGAPSTIRCIKTRAPPRPARKTSSCQGAPSTIRCIKTCQGTCRTSPYVLLVREHPAPSGALRLAHHVEAGELRHCHRQGAPSTIRCIKTTGSWPGGEG